MSDGRHEEKAEESEGELSKGKHETGLGER